MTWTLLRKELQQHWVALVLLLMATLVGYPVIAATERVRGQAGTAFEGLRLFVIVLGLLSGLVLCHRLVVLEFQAKTQLFLAALPVARWRMLAVKYGLGLAVMFTLLGLSFTFAVVSAWNRELFTARFLAIVALRAFSVLWFAYSLFFVMGLLGRYRVALYLAGLLALMALHEHTRLQLDRFGPVALLDTRFAYETEFYPWADLRTTWALAMAFVALAFILGLVREGTVAALLAEKMSHREKIFVAALMVGLTWSLAVLSEKVKKAPFDLQQAATERRPGVLVKVAYGGTGGEPEARRLAAVVVQEVAAARDYLGLQEVPPLFITRRRDLDARRYERGELVEAEGIHVQANFGSKDWQDQPFIAWLLRETLITASEGRLELESKRWVLDGFALFWTLRERGEAPLAADKVRALRALYGVEGGFTSQDLRRWLSFEERVGRDIASAVAWSGIHTLAVHHGSKGCQQFLRAVLGEALPKDFRAALRERRGSTERRMLEATGQDFARFFQLWEADLAQARAVLAEELARLPRIAGEVEFLPTTADSRRVRYRASLPAKTASPTRYSFLYHLLPAYDEEVSPTLIRREQHSFPEQTEDELPEAYSRGQRLYYTFALEVPALECQAISGWKRRAIP
jgi:hypothetical protein